MELLLLLSAFLTALTGAITGVRAPDARVEQVACAPAPTRDAEDRVVPAIAQQVRTKCPPPPAFRAPQAFALASVVPIYLARLRI